MIISKGNWNNYKIDIIDAEEKIENIRHYWEKYQNNPNACIDYYITVIKNLPIVEKPLIISIKDMQNRIRLVAGRVEKRILYMKLGYKKVFKYNVRSMTIIYGGLMGEESDDSDEIVLKELRNILKQKEADIVYFNNIDVNSNIYKIGKNRNGIIWGDNSEEKTIHWEMDIPGDMETFYLSLSQKRRHEIKRKSRQFEKKYDKKIKIKTFSKKEEIDRIMDDGERIARKTYQREMGVGFMRDGATEEILRLWADKDMMRAYFMYIEGSPAAFWVGTIYKNKIYLDYTGYDPEFRSYDIGTYLFIKMIEDLINLGISKADFGFGDASYKQRYGTRSWEEGSIYLFAPKIKNFIIIMNKKIFNFIEKAAKEIGKKTGLFARVKKYWRERLRNKRLLSEKG